GENHRNAWQLPLIPVVCGARFKGFARLKRRFPVSVINNPPGKNCLAIHAYQAAHDNPVFTSARQGSASRLFSPASPTASPESEYLSHGCVASRGVCKGAPH